jgi:hypothetical protein
MLVDSEGEAGKHPGARAYPPVVVACPEASRDHPATRACSVAVCVRAADAVGGAPVAVAIGGRAREMQRELGKAKVWPAWAEETRK